MTGPVTCLRFSPDGSKLATGGMEGALRVWNIGVRRGSSRLGETEGVSASPSLLGLYSAAREESRSNGGLEGSNFYSMVGGYEISRKCLLDAFFTRKTAVQAVKFAHPYLLLTAGPFNQV